MTIDLFGIAKGTPEYDVLWNICKRYPNPGIHSRELFTCWRPGPGSGYQDQRILAAIKHLEHCSFIEVRLGELVDLRPTEDGKQALEQAT